MKRLRTKDRSLLFPALLFAAALSACGGGGGGGVGPGPGPGPGPAGTPIVTTGTMSGGSVVVNGVAFTVADNAVITIDDDSAKSATDLADGMIVKVKGTFNSDNVTGTADRIRAADEVEGPIQGIVPSTASFFVDGQQVFTDNQTVFADTTGLSGANPLAIDNVVEVHGYRDLNGDIQATRVEVLVGRTPAEDVKGTVSGLVPGVSFNIGALVVNFTASTPGGSAVASGDRVEVKGALDPNSGEFDASRIELEAAEEAAFEPAGNQAFEVEGFISGFTVSPGTFFVNDRKVQTTASTVFVNGAAADLANNAKVEAEGTFDNVANVLAAGRISFHGIAAQSQPAAKVASASVFQRLFVPIINLFR